MAGNSTRPQVSVTSRVLDMFAAYDEEHRSLTLTVLARRAGLPLATAHRLAAELVRAGALVRQDSGEYVVGRRMWDLGLLAPVETGLRHAASPFLHDLYGTTLATVHLAVRDGTAALYVERVSGHASVRVVSQVGSRLPMHATGVGKVLLAHAPEEIRTAVLGNLTRVTPYTVTQPGRLRDQLRRVPGRRARHHQRGDDPGRVLGGRTGPRPRRGGGGGARFRGAQSAAPRPAAVRAAGRRPRDRAQPVMPFAQWKPPLAPGLAPPVG